MELCKQLSYERSLHPGKAVFYYKTKSSEFEPLEVETSKIRGQKSSYSEAFSANGAPKNLQPQDLSFSNPVTLESCYVPPLVNEVCCRFSLRVLANSLEPAICSDDKVRQQLKELAASYKQVGGYGELARRYSKNILSGRWLWRNQQSPRIEVEVVTSNDNTYSVINGHLYDWHANWKGDEKKQMLTRIYGIGFETQKELRKYENMMEEAAKRDHRKLGKSLDLFSFHQEGPGFVFWHPRGLKLRENLIEYWREVHEREGYEEIKTPTLLAMCAWDRSGHTETFIDKMFLAKTHEDEDICYALKPMNCDGGMLIFKSKQISYRDLPIRMGELGTVYRYERDGEVHGLMRAREFTQDDAHIYCTQEQIKDELKKVIKLALEIYETFQLELSHIEFSTRPEKSIGSDEIWEKAENTMKETIEEEKIKYQINEGDGAFYGPKLDFHLKDSVGRTWQCATIQLDFAQPENFDLNYIDENGEKVRPVMIHRTIYGSLERFLGILIEHYAGKLPLWLAPEQIAIVPIAERHLEYANTIAEKLKEKGLSCHVNYENDTMQLRIRQSELMKIPYILVVGDKEEETQTVSIRPSGKKELGIMKIEEFLKILNEELSSKAQESSF